MEGSFDSQWPLDFPEEKEAIAFWNDTSEEILKKAKLEGIPFCELDDFSQAGISFVQIRYKTKKGKEKTKWLTNKWLKKKQTALHFCKWTFLPLGISSIRKSLKPEGWRYDYQIRVESNAKDGNKPFVEKVGVKRDGTIIGKTQMEEQIPNKLHYPKQMVARLNRFFIKYFLAELWSDYRYAAWYRSHDGYATYMGIGRKNGQGSIEGLEKLLQSPYGNAAAVLLSYNCFSLLKPWLLNYPDVNLKSPYLTVKKRLPKMFAINIRSNDLVTAENIAEYCCGEFDRMGNRKFPIIDGVDIQKVPGKQASLSENAFEQRILQQASVLWVNRKPSKSLKRDGKMLDLQVPMEFTIQNFAFDVSNLIATVVYRVEEENRKVQEKINSLDVEVQKPIIRNMVSYLKIVAQRYSFEFQEVELDESLRRILNRDWKDGLIREVVALRESVESEIEECAAEDVDSFLDELQQLFSVCLREMRKAHKKNQLQENSSILNYEDALREMKEKLSIVKVAEPILEKISYLWASAKFFITALPKENQGRISRQILQSLCTFAKEQKDPWSASIYLKKYLAEEIRNGNCARIRGERSDSERITVWYDPQKQVLLLPSKTYFENLCSYIEEPQVTKRIFEQKLTEEGLLLTVKRGGQIRRTFEVKIRVGGGSDSVLKIPLEKLGEGFRKDTRVQKVLQQLYADDTPLRTD